jgi:oxygen-independent coproporphyrinogen-3 oxidase
MDALDREIRVVAAAAAERIPVHTVFLGGGTPSLIPVPLLARLLDTLRSAFHLLPEAEITLEANPGTVTREGLLGLRSAGYNRISYGVQSAHPADLQLLERQHDFLDVIQAVRDARQSGFDQLSLDLIFGIPGQTLSRWQETLRRAVDLRPEHLSLYALTIEHGTPFLRLVERGLVDLPDDDLAADMYEWATAFLAGQGYEQYEISNWATRRGEQLLAAQHNLQYWRNRPYFGFGAGAHGYVDGVRTVNVSGVKAYVQRVEGGSVSTYPAGPAAVQATPVDTWTAMQEAMMVGLRLTQEGVSAAEFLRVHNVSLADAFGSEIDPLIRQGLLEWAAQPDGRHLRLTEHGRLLGNRVFAAFVSAEKPAGLAFV